MSPTFNKKNPLLLKCLAASIGLHLIGLSIFYSRPFLLDSSFPSLFTRSTSTQPFPVNEEPENEKLNAALEEVFKEIVVLSPDLQKPYDSEYTSSAFSPFPQLEEKEPILPSLAENLPELKDMQVCQLAATLENIDLSEDYVQPIIAQEENEDVLFSLIQIDKARPETVISASDMPSVSIETPFIDEPLSAALDHAALKESVSEGVSPLDLLKGPSIEQLSVEQKIPQLRKTSQELSLDKSQAPLSLMKPKTEPLHFQTFQQRNTSLPQLESYALPTDAGWLSWGKNFNIDLQVMRSADKENYIFSITLLPAKDLREERINQNFYFLIDRSNSISKDRLAIFKKAVIKALSSLQEGDTFNISLFDQKIVRLSENNLPINKDSIKAAEVFLEKQEPGGLFAAADLYKSLERLIPDTLSEDDLNVAILLSDGEAVIRSKKQQKKIREWVQKIQGKISLYTAAAGTDNNMSFLSMLSSLSGGKFLYSDTHSAFPRRLAKLLLDLRHPISTRIDVSVVPSDPEATITLSSVPSPLYVSQPYTIVGTCDDLTDFTLILEGKHEDEWIRIDKSLSFSNAKQGGRDLEKKWASIEAQKHYELFLQDGDVSHLEKAQEFDKIAK